MPESSNTFKDLVQQYRNDPPVDFHGVDYGSPLPHLNLPNPVQQMTKDLSSGRIVADSIYHTHQISLQSMSQRKSRNKETEHHSTGRGPGEEMNEEKKRSTRREIGTRKEGKNQSCSLRRPQSLS